MGNYPPPKPSGMGLYQGMSGRPEMQLKLAMTPRVSIGDKDRVRENVSTVLCFDEEDDEKVVDSDD